MERWIVPLRVSGETIRVTDPALLDALIWRGRHARERSETFAERAALRALEAINWKFQRTFGLSIALAPIGLETEDVGSRLFTPAFTSALVKSLCAYFATGPYAQPDDMERSTQQDAFTAYGHFLNRHGPQERTTWLIQATGTGQSQRP